MKFDTISIFPAGGSFLGKTMDNISPIFDSFQKRLAKNYIIITISIPFHTTAKKL